MRVPGPAPRSPVRRAAALLGAGALGACELDDPSLYTDPPAPVFASLRAECDGDVLTATALLDGALPTANLVLVPTEADGFAREAVYPLTDLSQGEGRITRWTAALAHDCDDELVLEWSAYTPMGTESHARSRYPLAPPEVDGLNAPYGSDAGGDRVFFRGSWLAEVHAVTIGGAAAALGEVTDEGLWLETPPGAPGPADVVVSSEAGDTPLPGAFTYYPDQSGLTRGIGNFALFFHEDALVPYDSVYGRFDGSFAQFEVAFHEPLPPESHWWARWPEPGDCGVEANPGFVAELPSPYLDLDHDGELGAFALVTDPDEAIYHLAMGGITVDGWADQRFDLSWSAALDDLPAMALPGGVWTAPLPDDLSLDWKAANPLQRGEDLAITFSPHEDVTSALVTPYVVRGAENTVLRSFACADDPSDGDLSLLWSTLMDGVDPARAERIYLLVDLFRDQPVTLPHDGSVFWARGVTRIWFRVELHD